MAHHAITTTSCCGNVWHVLASTWRLWQCNSRGQVSRRRNWIRRRRARVRIDRPDHGLRTWTYIGLSLESGRQRGPRRCRPLSCPRPGALYCCAGCWRDHWGIRAVSDRVRRARIRRGCQWLCIEWIRCAFTRRLFDDSRPDLRNRDDVFLPDGHSRHNRRTRYLRFRAASHRALPDADSSDIHPGNEYLGQSRALDRTRTVRRWRCVGTTLAFLGRAHHWRMHCRRVIPALFPEKVMAVAPAPLAIDAP